MIDFALFFQEQQKVLTKVSLKTKRYLYGQISWSERCIAVLGQRGVGKTTLMLQYIKEHYKNRDTALYISVDNPYFKSISLYEFALAFERQGGKVLFIDEVHKYRDWSSHIKSIYDMTALKVVFSGSSMLQISSTDADLSRRSVVYRLANLSFREYLEMAGVYSSKAYDLTDILTDHVAIASEVMQSIKPLKHFNDYLRFGCYPFFNEGLATYNQKLIAIVNQILETDLPYIENINFSQIDKIKKLLYILAVSVPFTPNISKLSAATEISRVTMGDYMRYLELASLTNRVGSVAKGYSKLQKLDKLYLYNTNLAYAINRIPDIGTARETFFVNQTRSFFYHSPSLLEDDISLSENGDFILLGTHVVEVGGKNKGFEQIKDIPSSYVAADDCEVGYKNKIPLWLFGFLY